MGWSAKPSGGYSFSSAAGRGNVLAINGMLNQRGYTLESQAGVIGNVYAESALNPWRWQSDVVDYSGGYGLFQFTPASGYINGATRVQGYAPNLSTSSKTPNSSPNDGGAQVIAFADDILNKWVGSCWRSYWSTSQYADLYAIRKVILDTYGNGSYLTMNQFKTITDTYLATFAFLACYEGPAVPNMDARYNYATAAYSIISSETPPPTTERKKMPIYFMLKPF